MKKLLFSVTIVLVLPLFFGCASLTQTANLQEVIRKPKNYSQLKTAEKMEVTLNDITKYDSSSCYTESGNGLAETGILLEEVVVGRKNEYFGRITDPWGDRGEVIIMPYPVKGVTRKDPRSFGTIGHSVRIKPIPEDLCLKKTNGSSFTSVEEYAPYYGKALVIVRVIKKRQLSLAERQTLLRQKQNEFNQKYIQKQQEYKTEYDECNAYYDEIVNFWENNTNIKRFCNSVENTWFDNECLATSEDNETCQTLKSLFIDCYQQGAIRADDGYVSKTFFKS